RRPSCARSPARSARQQGLHGHAVQRHKLHGADHPDQQATSVAEVLTNSDPSVRAAIGSSNRYDAMTIRGFRVENSEIARNGLYGLVPNYRVNPAPIERIELLKGPAAFLYGMAPQGSIGGSVNVVTKRAGDDPLTRLTAGYMSNARFGTELDVARRY